MAVADFPIYEAIEAAARREWLRALGYSAENISLSSPAVSSGSPNGTVVGRLLATSSEFALSVVSGPFTINGSGDLVLTGVTGAAGSTLTARINALRASPYLSITQDVGVTVTASTGPVDTTAPTITSASSFSFVENSSGSLALTSDEAVTWAKVGGADASLFTLTGSTLSITAKNFETPADFNGDNIYVVQVSATDASGNVTTQTITGTCTDANEAPTGVTIAWRAGFTGGVVPENTAVSTVLADLNFTDPDAAATGTFSEVTDADSKFTVTGSTLVLSAALNFEAKTSHSVVIGFADQGALAAPNLTASISVSNANEAPTNVTVTWRAGFTGGVVPETTATGTVLADLAVVDPDAGDSVAFTELSDPDSKFTVTGSTLVLSTAIDYETKTSHAVTVRATDSGTLSYDKVITVTVGDVTEVAILPAGSTFTWIGDGLSDVSSGVGAGASNPGHQFQNLMGSRLQPTAFPIMALSGTTIKTASAPNQPWIYPYAIDGAAAQTPDVFIIGTMGGNDNVLSLDPSSSWMQDWKDAVTYAYSKFVAYGGKLFVVVGTAPSTKPAEPTYRAAVWAAQAAHVASLGGGTDGRVVFVPLTSMLPASNYSSDTSSLYVHLDERGALYIATQIKSAIDTRVEAKTPDQILDMIFAGTYPLMGAQLDTDTALTGTAGTLTGPGVTGTIATSKLITNTTGATGISVSQVATTGGRTKTVVSFAAATATSSAGRIVVSDKANVTYSTTPGQYIMTGVRVKASAGFWNFGGDFAGNNWGKFGGGGSSLAANGKAGAGAAQAMDTIFMTNPLPLYGATYANRRYTGFYWPAGVTPSGTLEFERPFSYVINERTRHAPYYLGDVMSGAGIRPPTGGALISGFPYPSMRPSGTVSQAAGGTVRVEPGLWTPRGLTEADFGIRRIYKGTASDTAWGSGTLLATISGSTWTAAIAAGAVSTGDLIYVEMAPSNGIGGAVNVRSKATISVT